MPPSHDDVDHPTEHSPVPAEAGGSLEARIAARVDPESLDDDRLLVRAKRTRFLDAPRPIVGKIVLLRSIGRGGMGVVYLGVNPRLGNLVALKVLPPRALELDAGMVPRFFREARIAANLHSPHLVQVLDVDHDERSGLYYLVMEYVDGRSAADLIRSGDDQPMPESDALDVVVAATKGLAAAHLEGVIHRDIKPANILVPWDATSGALLRAAKLADLGLARPDQAEQDLTGTEVALGTPGYIAPEQVRDARNARKPADVFSMGCTLYSLLSGRAPFRGSSSMDALLKSINGEYPPLDSVRTDVSGSTRRLIECCLEPEPEKRYCDAPALLAALEVCRAALDADGTGPVDVETQIVGLLGASEQGRRVDSNPSAAREATRKPVPTVAAASAPPTELPSASPSSQRSNSRSTAIIAALAIVVVGGVIGLLWGAGADGAIRMAGLPDGAVVTIHPVDRPELAQRETPRGGLVRFVGLEPGDWSVTCSAPGYAEERRVVAVVGRHELEPRLRTATERELDATDPTDATAATAAPPTLSFTVTPAAAEIRVDGVAVGVGQVEGLEIESGRRVVSVHAPGFVPWEESVEFEAGVRKVLDAVQLERVPTADLSALGPDTEVWLDGTRVRDDDELPTGETRLELRRTDHAVVVRTPTLVPGEAWRPEPPDWTNHQAVLEIRGLVAGIRVEVGGREARSPLRFAEAGDVRVLLHSGNGQRREVTERVTLGGHHVVELESDDPLVATRLSVADSPPGVVLRWNGREVTAGALVPPGTGVLEASLQGHVTQTFELSLAAASTRTVRLGEFEPVAGAAALAGAILSTRRAWDAASTDDRVEAATWISDQLRDFSLAGIEPFEVAGASTHVAWLRHGPTNLGFALIPGTAAFGPAGADRAVPLDPFLMSRTEVTQAAWERFMPAVEVDPGSAGDHLPQHSVTWYEASEFCRKAGLNLPTEAQWEYAARAGATGEFVVPAERLPQYAHFDVFTRGAATLGPVRVAWTPGQGEPDRLSNRFGLFDVHGNVAEWCRDVYTTDPTHVPRAGDGLRATSDSGERVLRGGGFVDPEMHVAFSKRAHARPGTNGKDRGFRPIRELGDILD